MTIIILIVKIIMRRGSAKGSIHMDALAAAHARITGGRGGI